MMRYYNNDAITRLPKRDIIHKRKYSIFVEIHMTNQFHLYFQVDHQQSGGVPLI